MKIKAIGISAALLALFCGQSAVCAEGYGGSVLVVNDRFGGHENTNYVETVNGSEYISLDAFLDILGVETKLSSKGGAVLNSKGHSIVFDMDNTPDVVIDGMPASELNGGCGAVYDNGILKIPFEQTLRHLGYEIKALPETGIVRVYDSSATLSDAETVERFGAEAKELIDAYIRRCSYIGFAAGDKYRRPLKEIREFDAVRTNGTECYEKADITDEEALDYADIVNKIADAAPGANVYSILVPSASEFYAPAPLYENQAHYISMIYDRLNKNITPVNACQPMYEHAGEKLYFETDHHWTQRGAYYAYKAFIEAAGDTIADIDEFEKADSYDFVGYWADYLEFYPEAEGIRNIMMRSPEVLERFVPKSGYTGATYDDGYMQSMREEVSALYPQLSKYMTFIGGDNPLTVFRTNVGNGKKLCIIKESYGDAFSVWALNNYSEVYILDPRYLNAYDVISNPFNLRRFYEQVKFDDMVILNYPVSVSSKVYRNLLRAFLNEYESYELKFLETQDQGSLD